MIRNRLDDVMWEKRVTNAELARRVEMTRQYVGILRNNPDASMTKETMERLCNALGVTMEELFYWVEEDSQIGQKSDKITTPHAVVSAL